MFREAELQDVLYLLEEEAKPQQFRDGDEVMDVVVGEWRETLRKLNENNQLIEGMLIKNIVGEVCVYKQRKPDQENEEKKDDDPHIIKKDSLKAVHKLSLSKKYEE